MASPTPLKLLVVDDEKGIVDFTKKIYSRKGFVTFGAYNGDEAVEIFRNERPHISLIDIHMPYSAIDGIQALKKIKEIDNKALCIMVSRLTDNQQVALSKAHGAFAYVSKPLRLEELDKVIEEAVRYLST